MENTNPMDIEIGTQETAKLRPIRVKVVGKKVEPQKKKDGTMLGDKVTLICKHPDKDEFIELSSVEYLREKNVKNSALWFTLDGEGKISKNSALATTMNFYGCKKVSDFEGKEIETILDSKGYLTIKAY